MASIKLYEEDYKSIINSQRISFFESLGVKMQKHTFTITFTDKNFICAPYINKIKESKIQGLSFFSGAGGLDIGAQMSGIKVLTSLDIDKDSIATLQNNKFFF